MSRRRGTANDRRDEFGFDESRNFIGEALQPFIPQWLVRNALRVQVQTNRDRYEIDDSIHITITFTNRLPVPVVVETPRQQLWRWRVDEYFEATNERRYVSDTPNSMGFRARETKRIERTWNGRIKQTNGQTRWEPLPPGEHEIAAFVATKTNQPADSTTIQIG